jgi:uncharacterized membrane protein
MGMNDQPTGHPPRGQVGGGRLLGIDLARGVALVAMMAAHILPFSITDETGAELYHPVHVVVDGRAAALFAVLAGVSLTLVTGRTSPPARTGPAAAGIAARAAVIAVIGLSLGVVSFNIAVILVNYAVLFIIAIPLIRLGWAGSAAIAGSWIFLGPIASFLVRQLFWPGGYQPGDVPSWWDVTSPFDLAVRLTLTGYYPVLVWTGYMVAGMALGRSRWLHDGSLRSAAAIIGAGTVLALGAKAASALLMAVVDPSLSYPADWASSDEPIDEVLVSGQYGSTPTTSIWWLITSAPHTGTPFDLMHTVGTSFVVIGACVALGLGAARLTGTGLGGTGVWALTPLAWAGSMTLTLYSVHVLIEAVRGFVDPWSNVTDWLTQAGVLISATCIYRLVAIRLQLSGRGPLEALVGVVSTAAQRAVSGAPQHRPPPLA